MNRICVATADWKRSAAPSIRSACPGTHVRDAHRRIVDIVSRVLPGLIPIAERANACEYPTNVDGANAALANDGWDVQERNGVLGITGPSLFKFAPLLGRLVAERLGSSSVSDDVSPAESA